MRPFCYKRVVKFIFFSIALILLLSACQPAVTTDTGERGSDKFSKASRPDVENGDISQPNQTSRDDVKIGQITGLDIERLFSMLQAEQVLLVDCRPFLYYRIGHIDGAINMPYRKYEASIDKIVKRLDEGLAERKLIVLYCQNYACPDAYRFAEKIAKKGYSTSIYKGGWQEWKVSGL